MVFGLGYFLHFSFKLFEFDVKKVEHKFINDHVKLIKDILSQKKKDASVSRYKE